jgi:hypothetical protein
VKNIFSHFWICTSSFLDSTLVLASGKDAGETTLAVIDPFGKPCNRLVVTTNQLEPVVLDAEALLGNVSFDRGIRHGQVVVTHPASVSVVVRYSSLESGCFSPAATPIPHQGGVVFPVRADPVLNSIIYLMNFSSTEESSARVRAYIKNRSPEVFVTLPPGGVKLIMVEEEFKDLLAGEDGSMGYVRILSRAGTLGAGLLERRGPLEGEKFELGALA